MRNDLTTVLAHLLKNGYELDVAYDIGAHKGSWTGQYKKVLPRTKFFMFEANPRLRDPMNGHAWFSVALSEQPETKTFFSTNNTGDSFYQEQSSVYQTAEQLELQTERLDDFAKERSLPSPQLIKIDAQGSELEILRGGTKTLDAADILISEMSILPPSISYNHGAPTFDTYMKFLVDSDWIPVGVDCVHCPDNRFAQLDVVFLRKHIKTKYYGDNHFKKVKRTD